jgi:3'-phosphoadenosine 5'-phosphosulfate sulfotransferase (PAPS reductase)/FAD synthetase
MHYLDTCRVQHTPPRLPDGSPVIIHDQTIQDGAAWSTMIARARSEWPDPQLDALIERTVADIKRTVGSKRAAFAWSGTKDSLVLAHIARLAGIHRCVLAITDLEYPEFLRWVTDCMPDGLTVISTGLNLQWLQQYPRMLFPQGAHWLRHWHTVVQQRAHEQYYKDQKLGMLLLGHRREGHYSYGPFKELTWRDRSGVIRYTPLVDWSPAAMLSLIHRERIPTPPCYGWPRGLQVGPGPWPARQGTTSTYHGFHEVWQIDPDLVRSAAPQLPEAARWLDLTGRS